jgi:LEA14-like dessication related protein
MKQIQAGILLVIVLVSCKDIKDPELIGIDNVKMGKLGIAGSSVTLNIKYFNPNPFNAKLKEAEGDAWMDSTYLGHFKVDTLVSVPASSEFTVPVNLIVDMKYLLQNSMAAFMKQEVLIRITGTAKAGRHGFYKKFPLTYEGKQNLAKLFNQ